MPYTVIDWDVVVNTFATENPRIMVLKILWMKINMHETIKVTK